ncbi:MAG: hypothetical protein ACLT98_18765 [Eggerthellaceae bacterium]
MHDLGFSFLPLRHWESKHPLPCLRLRGLRLLHGVFRHRSGQYDAKASTSPIETYASGVLVLTGGILFGEIVAQGAKLLYSQNVSYVGILSLIGMFVLLASEWQFIDAAKMANETSAMGGTDLHESQYQENALNIRKFAKQYGLSPREQDVLNLLIKGRSVPLCDELFL